MALPYTFSGLSWSAFRNSDHGPWEYSGNLYSLWIDVTNLTIEIWKSIDGGDSWSEVDSANHPALWPTISNPNKSVSGHFDGTRITVGKSADNNTQFGFGQFNCSTDSWHTTIHSSNDNAGNTAATVNGETAYAAFRRSDGSVVPLASGTQRIMGTDYRCVMTRTTGTDITISDFQMVMTPVFGAVEANYDYIGACIDASDRTYVFAHNATNGRLECAVIRANNTFSSPIVVDSTPLASGNYTAGLPRIVDDTTDKVVIPYVDSTGDLVLAYANVADTPSSFSFQTITTTNDAEYTNSNPASIATNGTTMYVLWPNDADQDLYQDSGTTSGGFGTDTEIIDATTIQGISARYISSVGSGGVGYLYNEGGTAKYNGPVGAIIESLTAALSAEGTLTASADLTRVYLATLSAEGTLTASLTVPITELLTAALSATGSMTAALDLVIALVPDAQSAEGTLTASLSRVRPLASSLDAASDLTAVSVLTRELIASLDAVGSVTVSIDPLLALLSAMSATGSLTATLDNTLSLTSVLDATGTLTNLTNVTKPVQASLDAVGSLASDAVLIREYASALSAQSDMSSEAVLTRELLAALSATGTLTLAEFFDLYTRLTAALDASGTLTADAVRQAVLSASLDGVGSLVATFSRDRGVTSALSAATDLTSAAAVLKTYLSAMDSTGSLSALAGITKPFLSALSAEGTLTTAVDLSLALDALLSAEGTLASSAQRTRGFDITLDAASDLSVVMRLTSSLTAAMSGEGTLATSLRKTAVLLAALSGTGTLTADLTEIIEVLHKIGGMIRTEPPDPISLTRTLPSDPLSLTITAFAGGPLSVTVDAPADPFLSRLSITEPTDPLSLTRTLPSDPISLLREEGEDFTE
jgi:hypothetical protein